MNDVQRRMDNAPCMIQDLRQPAGGRKREDYIFYVDGYRYDISKWFGHNGNFKYK